MSALSVTAGVRPFPLAMQHFYSFVSHAISLLPHLPQTGDCWGFSMLSKSVLLAAGQRLPLPSGLSPFVSLFVVHCVRLVSFFCPAFFCLLFVARCQPLPCNPLHLSPSSGLRVACNPLHVSPVSLCLHLSPSSGRRKL